MAIYRFSATIVTRAKGQSACAQAAYISGEKIVSDYDGRVHDYTKKQNVVMAEVLLPEHAPENFRDDAVLWNEIETNEKSSTAQLARSIQISLPVELMEGRTAEDYNRRYICLSRDFIQKTFVDDGMTAFYAVHNPPRMNSKKQPVNINGEITNDPAEYIYDNPHIHIMLSMRPLNEQGKWTPKSQKLYVCEKDGIQRNFPLPN